MSFYADILPLRKGIFRAKEYIKAQTSITENFQFRFKKIDFKCGLSPKALKTVCEK